MGEFKGFMKYSKQKLDELPLKDRISNFDPYNLDLLMKTQRNKAHAVWIVGRRFVKQGSKSNVKL